MSRGLWFVAGAGAGMWAMVRARRAAEALTADGLRDRLSALSVGARMVRDEVAQGRADAETDLRERLGMSPDGPRALPVAGDQPTSSSTQTSQVEQAAPRPIENERGTD
ncbi:DUF6167 family protein [Nocardioides bruguierae]|uniref:DUF6167 family protein n=1 Tax=Nocardioides bruguierae TaxID=2945102 RepID=A0A9X2DA06_9ACTN|nr:DUF6167 family protein [Nocardioides bruguierae]MCM0622108.1 DUF6167 family protein [Nocardioides bruguierae]